MNRVRLMPDYGCFPLWNPGGRPYAQGESSLPSQSPSGLNGRWSILRLQGGRSLATCFVQST
jgi:hypothetical protein